MRYSPYIASVSMSFSQIPQNYTEAVLDWSEPGLQTSFGDYLEYTSPGSGALLYSPINNESRLFRFLGFPANQNIKGSVNATFNNGDALENALVNLAFVDWLDRFQVKYKPSSPTELDCLMTWQATERVLGYCDHYRVSVSDINGGKPMWVGKEASLGIHGIESGETVAVSLTAYDRSDRVLGTMDFILYAPTLKLIPERANISGMGYGKQIDTGGVQEIYQSNHNKTLAQLTTPTQSHSVESRSLSTNLPSMDPATVVSSNARDYVNSFDPNQYNQPLDYSDAKAAGAAIAPQATATLNQQHQGNYTLNHQGSLNQTRTVTNDTQVIQAPQINNTVDTYTGTYQGDTFSQTAENYYEQNENELNIINEHNLQAPSYEENVNNLTQEIGTSNINAQSINFNGNTLNINGTLYIDGKCDLGFSSGCTPRPFVQLVKTPNQQPDKDYQGFVATVYAETLTSRVLMQNATTRYASGALVYYWYVSGKLTYQQALETIQSYINTMNANSSIHSFKDTGFYNTPDFSRAAKDDTFAKKAVASVIVNRAKKGGFIKDYSVAKTPARPNGDIVAAYTDTYAGGLYYQFNGYRDQNYYYAMNAMHNMQRGTDISNISDKEVQSLYAMLWKIYYNREVTTDANFYISPITQVENQGDFPDFALILSDESATQKIKSITSEQQQLQKLLGCWRNIWGGLNIAEITDDFAFLSIPGGRSLWH